jgi:hypothetical protein
MRVNLFQRRLRQCYGPDGRKGVETVDWALVIRSMEQFRVGLTQQGANGGCGARSDRGGWGTHYQGA